MSGRRCFSVGAIICGLAVGSGAFAAHGLDKFFVEKYADQTREVGGQSVPLAAKFLNDFKTGAEYQMYHGLAIIAAGLLDETAGQPVRRTIAAWSFLLGIILFSGSLYVLTLTGNVTKWRRCHALRRTGLFSRVALSCARGFAQRFITSFCGSHSTVNLQQSCSTFFSGDCDES